MQRIIYIPPWENPEDIHRGIDIGLSYPYIIGSPRGVGGVEAQLSKGVSPYAAGAPVYGVSIEGRDITFYIHIRGNTRKEMYEERLRLTAALTPFNGRQWDRPGRVYYENDAGQWWIPAIPIKSPDPQERTHHYNRAEIRFFCPDPYFKSIFHHEVDIIHGGQAFEFPFEFPVEFSYGTYSANLICSGSVATPVIIRITGTLLENPIITNERTGEIIKIIRAIGSNYELIIDTSSTDRSVRLKNLTTGAEENAYRYIDMRSRFWSLLPGENVIQYFGEEENFDARVVVSWYDNFAGV